MSPGASDKESGAYRYSAVDFHIYTKVGNGTELHRGIKPELYREKQQLEIVSLMTFSV